MTVQRSRGRGEPSGRSSTARRCCSNWPVTAPSIDQCPELCGRIASSLTTKPGLAGQLEQLDGEHAGDVEGTRDPQRRLGGPRGQRRVEVRGGRQHLGADAVGLHGLHHRPRRRLARRAAGEQHGELAAEGHPLLEEQPGAGGRPPARASRRAPRPPRPRGPPCRRSRPAGSWRPPASRPRRRRPRRRATVSARAQRGHGIPRAVSRSRIASLSCAKRSASGCGCSTAPSATSSARTSGGTCSWSKVTTSHAAANRRTASASVCAPTGEDGTTRAALASSASASTLRVMPSSAAGPAHIRASWPPPMTPTTGKPPGARRGVVTGRGYRRPRG